MSLKGACVDVGRIIRLEPSATRVEGRTTFEPVAEQWFRCRLTISEGSSRSAAPARSQSAIDWRARVMQAQLMTITVDQDGNTLEFRTDQLYDVSSIQLGRAIWRSMGEPEPIRKKRKLIGYLVNAGRVIEREFDDLLNEQVPHPDLTPVAQ